MKNSGIFAAWQPRYAACGVPTFPVEFYGDHDKKPAVTHPASLGLRGSAQLRFKFADCDALGFIPGRRTGITVLDVDTTSERVLHAAMDRYGEAGIIARTLSGHYHAWYKFNGEPRDTSKKFWPGHKVDLLGAGFAVAPPSRAPDGRRYDFIKGKLGDRLAPMRRMDAEGELGYIPEGRRDNTLFSRLLHEAVHVDDFDTLLDVARTINMSCVPPLPDAQVVAKAKQAWKYETEGRNWVGRRARASTDREEILALSHAPAAAMLLYFLRVSHPEPDVEFAIDQAKTAAVLGWARNTLAACIKKLIEAKRLERVSRGRAGDPHQYRLVRR